MAAAVALLLPTLVVTGVGWWRRRPYLYLAALAVAGVPTTVIGWVLAVPLFAVAPQPRVGLEGIGFVVVFFFGALTSAMGLYSAQAAAAWLFQKKRPPA